MKRPEPTLFDLMAEHGADVGVDRYRSGLTPSPDTSEGVEARQNGNLGPLFVEVATLNAEIRGLTAALRARRPIPYADPKEETP